MIRKAHREPVTVLERDEATAAIRQTVVPLRQADGHGREARMKRDDGLASATAEALEDFQRRHAPTPQ
jgi:hypothetical protein